MRSPGGYNVDKKERQRLYSRAFYYLGVKKRKMG